MKTIWKFTLLVTDRQVIRMPDGAEILCCQMQHGEPQLWAIVDPATDKMTTRSFCVFGTGHQIDAALKLRYIGTFKMSGGMLVFHVFEEL